MTTHPHDLDPSVLANLKAQAEADARVGALTAVPPDLVFSLLEAVELSWSWKASCHESDCYGSLIEEQRDQAKALLADMKLRVAQLLQNLKDSINKCGTCNGRGVWESDCPYCGDSTYDHNCVTETNKCERCAPARALVAIVESEGERRCPECSIIIPMCSCGEWDCGFYGHLRADCPSPRGHEYRKQEHARQDKREAEVKEMRAGVAKIKEEHERREAELKIHRETLIRTGQALGFRLPENPSAGLLSRVAPNVANMREDLGREISKLRSRQGLLRKVLKEDTRVRIQEEVVCAACLQNPCHDGCPIATALKLTS
jgi:hypothetical protein